MSDNDTKHLPPGIPKGRLEFKQRTEKRVNVLVSEDTRRIAHELDNMRIEWLKFASGKVSWIRRIAEESPVYFDAVPVNHIEWLTSDDMEISAMLTTAGVRIQQLQQQLTDIRETRSIDGRSISKDNFRRVKNEILREYRYLVQLVLQLKHVLLVRKSSNITSAYAPSNVEMAKIIEDDNAILAALIELREAIKVYQNELAQKYGEDLPVPHEEFRHAMTKARQLIAYYKKINMEDYIVANGVVTRKSDVEQ